MSRKKVLYVEDEEDYQTLVRHILGKAGMDVHLAATGDDGWRALDQVKPDLLILDINLPDTDGYRICQELRRRPEQAKLPVLLLTVRRRPDEWIRGFSVGADDYVTKPLNPPELIERVQACLQAPSSPPRLPAADPAGGEYLLIQAAATGNRMAFEVLIQKYKPRLLSSLRAAGYSDADSQDIAAHTFVRAYEQLRHFRGGSAFYTWLYRIAFNGRWHRGYQNYVSLDQLARRSGENGVWLAEEDQVCDNIAADSLKNQVQQTVERVPRPYREILKLHFFDGVSCRQIARRLRIPRGTVMSRLYTARGYFRKFWRGNPVV